MDKKYYDTIVKALKKQGRELASSKEAARKFLKDMGVAHLFVPKGTNGSTKPKPK
jgi:hypothetical protein